MGGACTEGDGHRAQSLVECRLLAYARCHTQSAIGRMGISEPAPASDGQVVDLSNRRVRTRTHGGVGGREGRPSLRPDRRSLGRSRPRIVTVVMVANAKGSISAARIEGGEHALGRSCSSPCRCFGCYMVPSDFEPTYLGPTSARAMTFSSVDSTKRPASACAIREQSSFAWP